MNDLDQIDDTGADEQTGGAADHMDAFRAPDLDLEATAIDAVREVNEDGQIIDDEPAEIDALSRDAFYTVFELGFSVPQMVNPVFAPVAIQPNETPQARGASDAVYQLLEIYYPRALMPMGDTVALLLASGMFFMAKARVAQACFGELKRQQEIERRGPGPVEQGNDQANENRKPGAAQSGYKSPLAFMDAEGAA